MDEQPTMQTAGQNVARQPEVSREVMGLQDTAQQLTKLAEDMTMRLSSVITPNAIDSTEKLTDPQKPMTPLASNLRDISKQLHAVEKTLRFILQGLEL